MLKSPLSLAVSAVLSRALPRGGAMRSSPRSAAAGEFRRAGRVATACAAPVLATLLVAACGGGGGDTTGTTPTAGTASLWADGPISGFGSVIVNGVRFDDTHSTVTDDEGRHLESTELKLGMEVEVEGGDDAAGHPAAQGFHVHSAVVGPVEAVDAAAGTLVVLGQAITVDAGTVIDDALTGGLAGLVPGAIVRVYGPDDGTGHVRATRLEAAGAVTAYRIVGAVAAFDAAGHRLTIGSATIDVSAIARLPEGLAAGSRVRVTLDTVATAGVWRATALSAATRHFEGEHEQAELHGTITSFTSATSFSVDGTPVDASKAVFPDGTAGIVPGAVVEIEGRLVGGTLVASKVSDEAEHAGRGESVELHGTISDLDTAAGTFTLRGSVVHYASDVAVTGGTTASLKNGLRVEVKGDLGSDGHTVEAATIDLEDH